MNRSIDIIRLELGGRWLADELGQALSNISDLYDLRLILELMREDQRDWEHFFEELMHFPPFRHRWKRRFPYGGLPWAPPFASDPVLALDEAHLSRLSSLLEPDERLEVRRISYGSPGASDLAGIGAIIGHIKDFILKIIERRDNQRQRELDQERAGLENDRIRIENARTLVALARDLGYSETDFRRLVVHVDNKQDILVQLVARQKLTGVSSVNEPKQG